MNDFDLNFSARLLLPNAKVGCEILEDKMRRILGFFSINSKFGTTVILEGRSDLPIGKELRAEIYAPGRAVVEATAYRDWPHPRPVAYEGYILMGIAKADLIDGTVVKLELQ
ncbi:hypothetical protein [Rhizobium leucaenae]|uniref:Uncharacterized protein n=1 Tax=Rhizobium leucaenae TaxID=29450 RepID=A0A7W6ZV81_9HYPH|nr:hypothetical protein [Rhizobium leucaenae]MBB4569347.1 hypothetical protein [Rhizobium leucaenae]MBB6302799.1 hypothetical protein [Rhizobium leucaenae]